MPAATEQLIIDKALSGCPGHHFYILWSRRVVANLRMLSDSIPTRTVRRFYDRLPDPNTRRTVQHPASSYW